jgi:hypothetical protein
MTMSLHEGQLLPYIPNKSNPWAGTTTWEEFVAVTLSIKPNYERRHTSSGHTRKTNNGKDTTRPGCATRNSISLLSKFRSPGVGKAT